MMEEKTMYTDGVQILSLLRTLPKEEQRIAYAVLEGMRLQKDLDSQGREQTQTGA